MITFDSILPSLDRILAEINTITGMTVVADIDEVKISSSSSWIRLNFYGFGETYVNLRYSKDIEGQVKGIEVKDDFVKNGIEATLFDAAICAIRELGGQVWVEKDKDWIESKYRRVKLLSARKLAIRIKEQSRNNLRSSIGTIILFPVYFFLLYKFFGYVIFGTYPAIIHLVIDWLRGLPIALIFFLFPVILVMAFIGLILPLIGIYMVGGLMWITINSAKNLRKNWIFSGNEYWESRGINLLM